jgi:hypothetical protein
MASVWAAQAFVQGHTAGINKTRSVKPTLVRLRLTPRIQCVAAGMSMVLTSLELSPK